MDTAVKPYPPLPKLPVPGPLCIVVDTCPSAGSAATATDFQALVPVSGGVRIGLPEPMSNESGEQYERFRFYLCPPEGTRRTFVRVARHYGLNTTTVEQAAERYDWRERAIQHDRKLIAITAERQGRLAADSAVSQYALATELLEQAATLVAQASDADAATWPQLALDISKVVERVQKIQRLALGLSTSNESVAMTIRDERRSMQDLRSLSNAELKAREWAEGLTVLMDRRLAGALHSQDAAELARLVAMVAP
ncbi:MAG: hypothetical protein JWN04_1205 [Myxococcaceae bacterium]|nr:hypothetical protein [Myxococcaceae bacterium]